MKNLKSDVVVIGGGAAGLPAAAAAAEKGASVILLEKRHVLGGNAIFAGDRPRGAYPIESAESRLQRSLAIENNKDEFFKNQMNYTHWNANPKVLRALLDKAGDTIRWLGEKGVLFPQLFNTNFDGPARISGPIVGGVGSNIIKTLTEYCKDSGVRIICDTQAKKILKGKENEVTGVLSEVKDGRLRIATKSVIIATGGFAGNKKMLQKYFPNFNEAYIRLGGLPNEGDGLMMASQMGAAAYGTAALEMEGPDFQWASRHYLPIFNLIKSPETVWVNRNGERYTQENSNAFEKSHSIYIQPGRVTYTLFDESIKQRVLNELSSKLPKSASIAEVDKDIRQHAEKGRVKISQSWDEIAAWMGATPEVLQATISDYNSFCDKGYDNLFLKDPKYLLPLKVPPYYAMRCYLKLLVTHGDIKVNHHMEVVDKQEKIIPGLYAAGVDIGGVDADTYNAPGLPGHSHGFSVISGRIAGENAVNYALSQGRDRMCL